MIENKKIQYKLGEDGTAKSFILEVTWTEEYPEVLPEISLDAFYNKHLIPSVKEQILEFAKSEAEQYLGMPMTFTIIEQGTIHILRKHFYSTKLNLTFKFFTKTGVFCQIKTISFSTLHSDKIFMLQFEIVST